MKSTKEIAPFINLDLKDFKDYNDLVDHLEKFITDEHELIELPLAHMITPGLYTREMYAPKGVLITSKPHNTEHQFIVSKGSILIFDEYTNKWTKIDAPYRGITRVGTRRIGYVLEDVIWTTIHSTDLAMDKEYTQSQFIELIDEIEKSIIQERDNNLLNDKN